MVQFAFTLTDQMQQKYEKHIKYMNEKPVSLQFYRWIHVSGLLGNLVRASLPK